MIAWIVVLATIVLALGTLLFFRKKSKVIPLYTKWGKNLNPDSVLQEYPRPQFQRDSYINLNGKWDYAITNNDAKPEQYDGEILVPFSPESVLSGVERQLLPKQTLWYHRSVNIPTGFKKDKVFLNFGAVDQECVIYINGTEAGSHVGGYLPFTIDITDYYSPRIDILVRVHDNIKERGQPYGKQEPNRGGIWYTATSGIWQTVWLESTPEKYIESVKITPDLDNSNILIKPKASSGKGKITIYKKSVELIKAELEANKETKIGIDDVREWSPEDPFLYKATIEWEDQDTVKTYFAMRKFSIEKDSNGICRIMLNNKPYFMTGLLDQGYWSDGIYTAPSDEALSYDIETMKNLGFNMLRKHIKIEPLRWYYHCDRLGMIVWQDAVSGGSYYNPLIIQVLPIGLNYTTLPDSFYKLYGRDDAEGRKVFEEDLQKMIDHLYNIPSIAVWVPFNEGWGQFDASRIADMTKKLDPTRICDHASGWHDQGAGDLKSLHVYFKRFVLPEDKERAIVLSEFGGYSLPIPGHIGSTGTFGYRMYKTEKDFNKNLRELYENQIIPAISKGLCATVYTQLSDVEDEVNGLLTYDRSVIKCDSDMMIAINGIIKSAYDKI